MKNVSLAAQMRPEGSRAKTLRAQKLIPAIVYGHGFATKHLQIEYQNFRRVLEQAGYSTIVTLDMEGEKTPVLIHEVQHNPVTDDMIHIDFYVVRMDEKVKTHIVFEFIGTSEAVKQGAMLITNKHEVEVSCLPGDLVHSIPIDISKLEKIGDTIRIKNLQVPKGIEILAHGEEPIISAQEIRVIEETPVAAAVPAEGAPAAPAEGGAAAPAPGAAAPAEGGKAPEKGSEKAEKKEGKKA